MQASAVEPKWQVQWITTMEALSRISSLTLSEKKTKLWSLSRWGSGRGKSKLGKIWRKVAKWKNLTPSRWRLIGRAPSTSRKDKRIWKRNELVTKRESSRQRRCELKPTTNRTWTTRILFVKTRRRTWNFRPRNCQSRLELHTKSSLRCKRCVREKILCKPKKTCECIRRRWVSWKDFRRNWREARSMRSKGDRRCPRMPTTKPKESTCTRKNTKLCKKLRSRNGLQRFMKN